MKDNQVNILQYTELAQKIVWFGFNDNCRAKTFNMLSFPMLQVSNSSNKSQDQVHYSAYMPPCLQNIFTHYLLTNSFCTSLSLAIIFFSLKCFRWTRSPFLILLCRSSEDCLQGSIIPDGSPTKDWQSTVDWVDWGD